MFKIIVTRLIGLAIAGCASGSAVVAGTKRPPVMASSVQLCSNPPSDYEVIGIVKASSELGLTEQGSMDYAVEELKNQAASIGANGLRITTVGGRGLAVTVVGEAIHVRGR